MDDYLAMIFVDTFTGPSATPQGGSRLNLDAWVIREGLAKAEFEEHAGQAGLTLHPFEMTLHDQSRLQTSAGVEIGFLEIADERTPPIGLFGVSYHGQRIQT